MTTFRVDTLWCMGNSMPELTTTPGSNLTLAPISPLRIWPLLASMHANRVVTKFESKFREISHNFYLVILTKSFSENSQVFALFCISRNDNTNPTSWQPYMQMQTAFVRSHNLMNKKCSTDDETQKSDPLLCALAICIFLILLHSGGALFRSGRRKKGGKVA